MSSIILNGKEYNDGISDIVEITQSAYNALPATKYTNNVLYCISDSVNGVDAYPPLIYSLEEREVGVWTDGKPLYEITKNIGQLTQDTSFHTIAHGISNIEKVVNVKGIMQLSTSPFRSYPIPMYRPEVTQGVLLSVNDTEIQYMNNWQPNAHTAYVTFQYTKTTDIAGGGTWNGQGGLAHHYSTSEKIIGTWVDGKPLYECTWEFENAITANSNSWTDTPISNATIKGIIDVKGYNINADKINCWNALSATADSGAVVKVIQSRNTQIVIKYLTLQYTKTAD